MEYGLHDIIEMKKPHPCKKSKEWEIIRMGADIKVKCQGCGVTRFGGGICFAPREVGSYGGC